MTALDEFLARIDRVSEVSGLTQTTLSTRLLGGGMRLSEIRSGKDIGVRRLAVAAEALTEIERQHGIPSPEAAPPAGPLGASASTLPDAAEHPHDEEVEAVFSEFKVSSADIANVFAGAK